MAEGHELRYHVVIGLMTKHELDTKSVESSTSELLGLENMTDAGIWSVYTIDYDLISRSVYEVDLVPIPQHIYIPT